MTIADLERFTPKNKSITYIGAYIELYNWKNHRQIHEIHRIVEFEKWRNSMFKNLCNPGAHRIIEISSILHSAHIVLKDREIIVIYVNNYIDWE